MSLSGAHKSAFRREVTREGRVYAIRDEEGFPAPADAAGNRAVPFWSKPTRAQRVVAHVVAYRELEIGDVAVEDVAGARRPHGGRELGGRSRDRIRHDARASGAVVHRTGHPAIGRDVRYPYACGTAMKGGPQPCVTCRYWSSMTTMPMPS
jgi:hypothetical protein